jgi:ankyrin repeat protein
MRNGLTEAEVEAIRRRYSDLLNYQDDDVLAPWDPMTYVSSDDDTLLHIAAMRGDSEIVSLLLRAGMDPNVLGDLSFTPLHYARTWDRGDVADILIRYGARTDIRNEFGQLPVKDSAGPKRD